MNYFTKDELFSHIGNITELIELKLNDECSALVSKYGGRILGIFPEKDNYNMLLYQLIDCI